MLLETISTDLKKVRSVNSTSTSFPSKIPTITEPKDDAGTAAGAAVLDFLQPQSPGGSVQNGLLLLPYGLGADNDAFSMRIIGWRPIKGNSTLTTLWVPVLLAEVACIMCSVTGVAASPVLNTEFFCDTITLVSGNANVSIDINSPGGTSNILASILLDLKGYSKVEFTFDNTTNTPSMNCLYATL